MCVEPGGCVIIYVLDCVCDLSRRIYVYSVAGRAVPENVRSYFASVVFEINVSHSILLKISEAISFQSLSASSIYFKLFRLQLAKRRDSGPNVSGRLHIAVLGTR